MHAPESFFCLLVFDFHSLAPLLSDSLLSYGPAPGMELIPYFLGLAAWVGMAFLAILLSPFSALLRRFRKGKKAQTSETSSENQKPSFRESPGEDNPNRT